MFTSWIDDSIRYAKERYPAKLFLPVALALTIAAAASGEYGPQPQWLDFILSLLAALTLVFQFRLWDDIADLPYDRVHHPVRVLSRASSMAPFALNVVLAGAANIGLLALIGRPYWGAVLLNLAAFVWYSTVPMDWRRGFAGRHLLLLKYPAFVFLMAPAARVASTLALWMTAVYLGSIVYELAHDRQARPRRAI